MKLIGVILAAGRGVRLGGLTADFPKGLLKIGYISLMKRQMACLENNGVRDLYIVTGFADSMIQKSFGNKYSGMLRIHYIFNSRWNTANNIYSLYLAKDVAKEGFILINSDDLFHPEILRRLVEDKSNDAICVDDYKELGEEEMKVKLEAGNLIEINKTMDPATAHGEYIGLAKFGPEGARELFDILEGFVEKDDLDGWYEEAFAVLSGRRKIKAVSTNGLPWTEIDTPEDLKNAREKIWPEIRKLTGTK